MEKFKVGDRVRIKSWEDMEREYGLDWNGDINCGVSNFIQKMKHLCGRTATIEKIDRERVILKDWSNNDNIDWYYCLRMIEHVTFTKNDLQDFDILIDRDGDISLYYDGKVYGNTIDIDDLNNDLTSCKVSYCENADIVKVERPFKLETVFERKEEVKEMTMEELCEHFGCQVKMVKKEEE